MMVVVVVVVVVVDHENECSLFSVLFTVYTIRSLMTIWWSDAFNVPNFAICLLRSQ